MKKFFSGQSYINDGYYYFSNEDLSLVIGESLSENSFCVLSSLIKKNISGIYNVLYNKVRSVCYEMSCSKKSLTILILNNYIVCPRSGGKITAVGFEGYLLCPDYNLICSGTILCNDMFDCVDKKSEMTDVIYDYEIKTSQDIEDSEKDEIIDNVYELSEDGKCPQFCSQCNEKYQCIKCAKDFGIVENNENNRIKRYCVSNEELKTGYYEKDLIYYKCSENCIQCQNYSSCKICSNGFQLYEQFCYLKINNCEMYNEDGSFHKCALYFNLINNSCQLLGCKNINEN